jgi:hypothetical protein
MGYGILMVICLSSFLGFLSIDLTAQRKGPMAHLLVPYSVACLPLFLAIWSNSAKPEEKVKFNLAFTVTLLVLTGSWLWCLNWFLDRRAVTPNTPIPNGPDETRFVYLMFGWTVILATATVPFWAKKLRRMRPIENTEREKRT